MAGRLDGKVAVVTGGCSGIGLATVRALRRGGRAGRRSATSTTRAARRSSTTSPGCSCTATSPTRTRSTRCSRPPTTPTARSTSPSTTPASRRPRTTRSWTPSSTPGASVQEVNLTSVYLCCKAVLPYMLEQGSGSIINTASFVAVMGAATSQISYSASKGGVLSMSRELGVQFAREGVRVNALCPGPVNTPLLQELFAKDEDRAQRRLVHVPMGRFAEPVEIANAVRVPRLRRVQLHDRQHVPRRRRHLRRLRHAAVNRPLIGLSTYREQARWGVWDQPADLLPDAVRRRGRARGRRTRAAAAAGRRRRRPRWWRALDGLVVTGGADVDPGRYGAEPHPPTVTWRTDRDAWELALLDAADERDLPVLGICRGMQVMAVQRGGTLDQHLPDESGTRRTRPAATCSATSTCPRREGTRLRMLVGEHGNVGCHHHQAVREHPGFAPRLRRRRHPRGHGGTRRPVPRRRAVAPRDPRRRRPVRRPGRGG